MPSCLPRRFFGPDNSIPKSRRGSRARDRGELEDLSTLEEEGIITEKGGQWADVGVGILLLPFSTEVKSSPPRFIIPASLAASLNAWSAREDACNPRIGKFCTDPWPLARVDDRLALLRPEQGQMVSGGERGSRGVGGSSRCVPSEFLLSSKGWDWRGREVLLLFGIFGFLGVKGEVGREKEGERGNWGKGLGGGFENSRC